MFASESSNSGTWLSVVGLWTFARTRWPIPRSIYRHIIRPISHDRSRKSARQDTACRPDGVISAVRAVMRLIVEPTGQWKKLQRDVDRSKRRGFKEGPTWCTRVGNRP